MDVLVTGGAGFLGARLIRRLLAGGDGLPPVSRIVSADMAPCPVVDPRVESRVGSITDPGFVASIAAVDVVYHMAAVLSGQAEAEFDIGMTVNVDATRTLLEACRAAQRKPRFVFTSSLAVFGGPMPEVVPEDMVLMPQSSYGAEKAIGELMVCEYARRGFVDGIVCRLPTICVRPGKPNSAASSFVSGIIREPLAGVDSVCPVPLSTRLWIASPDVTVANLAHASALSADALQGRRTLNLPGLCVTAAEMLASLERLGGAAARARVTCVEERRVMDIVCSWPGEFDVRRTLSLGFIADKDFDSVVRQYMAGL
jgi:nucleoside-diphosphate-sugar epimerase